MESLLYSRENIKILVENGSPRMDIQIFNEKVPEDGALIRILFSLTGTRNDLSCLKDLASFSNIPGHFGYTSVGVVEEVGSCCSFAEKGKTVLLPAQYSKYISIKASDYQEMRAVLFKAVPNDVDKVDVLFLPALCTALKLYSNLDDPEKGSIIFLGCNIIGTVFLKLLGCEGIHPSIYIDHADMKAELLLENGGEAVIENGEQMPKEMAKKVKDVFVFSASPWIDDIRENSSLDHANFIDVPQEDIKQERYPWVSYDVQQAALDLISNGGLYFRDLIAQHIHAETVQETYKSIKENTYKGRVLVYDW
ncbi:MAG TPA: hypothetical protein VIO64_19325 [Pseudobacteroides sp.]|uniref:hypothetical protein n=1 Tax=Pseudobacteroides sp. TaxID=1968840 RepID=UPI002F9290ED